MPNPKTRSEFFYQVSESAFAILWPKHNAGLGLYTRLVGLVTVEVQDPQDSSQKIGIILHGSHVTDAELAKRVGCDLQKFRYEKEVLFAEGLLIQRRYQGSYRLAIRCSAKNCQQNSLDQKKYGWLKEALATSRDHSKDNENQEQPDSENPVEPDSRAVQPDSHSVEPDSLCGLGQQNQEDKRSYKRAYKKAEESKAEAENSNASPRLPGSKPNPEATPSSDPVAEVCAQLYAQKSTKSDRQSAFSGKYRTAIGELLGKYTSDELVRGYAEFIRDFDDFDMAHAPKRFVEGGADDIIAVTRDKERQRAEAETAKLEQERRKRCQEIERELLTDQEDEAWAQHETSPDVPVNSSALERARISRQIDAGNHTGFMRMVDLRAEAAKTPAFQSELEVRLAEPKETRQRRNDERQRRDQERKSQKQERQRQEAEAKEAQHRERIRAQAAAIKAQAAAQPEAHAA